MLALDREGYSLESRVLRSPQGIRLLLPVLSALGLVFALAHWAFNKDADFSKLSALAFLVVAVLLGIAIAVLRLSLLKTPLYLACLSYVTFVGIGPLVVPPNLEDPVRAGNIWPIVASWLGMLTMALGYVAGKLVFRSSKAKLLPGVCDSLVRLEKFGFIGGVLMLLGVTGAVLWVERIGGLDALRSVGYYERPPMLWYESALSVLMRPGLWLFLGASLAKSRPSFGKRLLLFLLILGALAYEGPLGGSRLHVITLVLTLGCLLRLGQTARRDRTPLFPYRLLILAGLSFVLTWGALRGYGIAKLGEMSFAELGQATTTSESPPFLAAFSTYDAYVRIVQQVPESIPYQWGETIWESLTVWIPREFWPSKPVGFYDQLTVMLQGAYGIGNTAPTAPGELYLNFGPLGLLIGMFLMGAGCAWMAQWISCLPSHGATASLLLYAATFPLPLAMLWGGSIQTAWNLAGNTLPIYVVFLLARFVPTSTTTSL